MLVLFYSAKKIKKLNEKGAGGMNLAASPRIFSPLNSTMMVPVVPGDWVPSSPPP